MGDNKTIVQEVKQPNVLTSLVIMLIVVAIIMWGCMLHGFDATVMLFCCTAVVCIYAVFVQKIPYNDLEKRAIESIASVMDALLVILSIGMVVGSFIACGTIPYIIHLGLGFLTPATFLPFIAILGGILSAITGSSWVVVGTLGLAAMGIAEGLGMNPALTAGCVLSGAYFGDKISPLSGDGPNFFAAVSRVELYHHCYISMYTTVPSFIVCIIIYAIYGSKFANQGIDASDVEAIRNGLAGVFNFGFYLWLPLIYLIAMTVLQVPALPAIASAGIFGFFCTMIFQGTDAVSSMNYLISGYAANTGNASVDNILTRGGMSGNFGTICLVCAAMMFAGFLDKTKILHVLVSKLDRFTKNRVSLTITTFITTAILCFACADTFFSCTIVGDGFREKYDELKLDRAMLSRTLGDVATTCCPMVPWSINGVYCATTLGVAVGAYAPYYFMALLAPVFAILCAVTGFGIRYIDEEGKSVKKLAK